MDPIPDPPAGNTQQSLLDILKVELFALPKVPYVELAASTPTCFEELETNEWCGLVGKPIRSGLVHVAVYGFINIIDKRHGKTIGVRTSKQRRYGCCNPDCDWKVTFKTKGKKSSNEWLMVGLPGKHSSMCHELNTIQDNRVLRHLPQLNSFIANCPNPNTITLAEVQSHLLTHGRYTAHIPTPSYYKVISEIRKQVRQMNADEYTKLCRWMRIYHKLNPTATVALLQDDDECCFYHTFLSIPNGTRIFSKLCQPMFYIDGAFSKTPEHDGVVLTLVALNGNSAVTIPLVVACGVPAETTNYMAWLIQMGIKAGFPMEGYPIMTDRGNLLAASRALKEEFNLTMNLKFCHTIDES
jgi:hypothetical protein